MSRAEQVRRLAAKLRRAVAEDFSRFHPVQHALTFASRMMPLRVGSGVRTTTLRAHGIEVGEGTVIHGPPKLTWGEGGLAKMSIGKACIIDVGCSFELGEAITIGDGVTLGNNVLVITTTHELGPREHRAGAVVKNAVHIEAGAWIGPRAVILPGVTVGAGAIVDAGSVVNKSVAPNTRVRGTPARVVEELSA